MPASDQQVFLFASVIALMRANRSQGCLQGQGPSLAKLGTKEGARMDRGQQPPTGWWIHQPVRTVVSPSESENWQTFLKHGRRLHERLQFDRKRAGQSYWATFWPPGNIKFPANPFFFACRMFLNAGFWPPPWQGFGSWLKTARAISRNSVALWNAHAACTYRSETQARTCAVLRKRTLLKPTLGCHLNNLKSTSHLFHNTFNCCTCLLVSNSPVFTA